LDINLTFEDGMLFRRLELLDRRQEPRRGVVQRAVLPRRAARLPAKIIDTTFMIAAMINGSPEPEDVAPLLLRALKRPSATSTSGRSSTRTTTGTSFPSAGTP